MAIAGILLTPDAGQESRCLEALQNRPEVVETRQVDAGKLAAVVECSSLDIQKVLEGMAGMESVLQLDVAYINFEDDMDSDGCIACPPHHSSKRAKDDRGLV